MNEQAQTAEPVTAISMNTLKEVKASKPKAKAKPAVKAKVKAKAKTNGKGTKGPAILRQYAPEYHRDTENKTAGGNVSVDSDDATAKALRGKPLDEVYTKAAKVLGVTVKELQTRYGKLNVGMQRMNLGNRIRGVANAK